MDIVSFTGRRRPTVKEEPKSPVQPPQKRKAYSTTDASSIGRIKILDSYIDTTQPSGKRQKSSSGTSQVQFDGIVVPPGPTAPPGRATRKSTRTAKANRKKDLREFFEHLGKELGAAAKAHKAASKICKDIAELMDKFYMLLLCTYLANETLWIICQIDSGLISTLSECSISILIIE